MATIYYYIPREKLMETLRCGMKLSEHYAYRIPIRGSDKKCMVGFLHPKDNKTKWESDQDICLKLQLPIEHCYVINEVSLLIPPKEYDIIPLADYRYGTFENPRVLFYSSLLPEEISTWNPIIDEPLLFDNSSDLFYQQQIATIMEDHSLSDIYYALCEYLDNTQKKEPNEH